MPIAFFIAFDHPFSGEVENQFLSNRIKKLYPKYSILEMLMSNSLPVFDQNSLQTSNLELLPESEEIDI